LSVHADAHYAYEHRVIRHGVFQAQRRWAKSLDLINSDPVDKLTDWLN
jgi:hypothetical protein